MTRKSQKDEHYFTQSPHSKEKYGLIHVGLRGRSFQFLTSSGVFSRKEIDLGTRVLVEAMTLPDKGNILDLGCGYGVVGIVAATINPKLTIVMTDMNRRATRLAMENVKLNRVRNAEVRTGYLYEPVKNVIFDTVLSNPPVSAGMETVKAIVRGAPTVMKDSAMFQMVIRSKIGAKTLPAFFMEVFGNFNILERKSGYRVLAAERFLQSIYE